MEPGAVHPFFSPLKSHLESYRTSCEKAGLTRLQAALKFIKGHSDVDVVIVGAAAAQELEQIVENFNQPEATHFDFSKFSLVEEKFLNPSKWELVS